MLIGKDTTSFIICTKPALKNFRYYRYKELVQEFTSNFLTIHDWMKINKLSISTDKAFSVFLNTAQTLIIDHSLHSLQMILSYLILALLIIYK